MTQTDVIVIAVAILIICWCILKLYEWYRGDNVGILYDDGSGDDYESNIIEVTEKYRSDYIGQLTAEVMHVLNFDTDNFDAANQLILTLTPADTTLVSLLESDVEFVAEINWRRKKVYCTYKCENEFIEPYHKDFAFGFKRNQISFSKLDKLLRQCVAEVQKQLDEVIGTSDMVLKGAQQIAAAKDKYSTKEIYNLLKQQLIREGASSKLMILLGAYIRRIAAQNSSDGSKKDSDK